MMATKTWSQIRKRVKSAAANRDDGLRAVALRLAVQTVLLVLVMLIALEVIVYFITQQALLGSLESRVKDRAKTTPEMVCSTFNVHCANLGPTGPRGPGGPPPGQGRPPQNHGGDNSFDFTISDASAAFVGLDYRIKHSDGLLGNVLLNKADVQQAFSTRKDVCCSVKPYQGQSYLVYTQPLRANGHIVGAVQTSISESQFRSTMGTLLGILLAVAL